MNERTRKRCSSRNKFENLSPDTTETDSETTNEASRRGGDDVGEGEEEGRAHFLSLQNVIASQLWEMEGGQRAEGRLHFEREGKERETITGVLAMRQNIATTTLQYVRLISINKGKLENNLRSLKLHDKKACAYVKSPTLIGSRHSSS